MPNNGLSQQLVNLVTNPLTLQSGIAQDLSGDPFRILEQAEQQMLCPHIGVIEVSGLFHRVFDDLLRPESLWKLPQRDLFGAWLDDLFDF